MSSQTELVSFDCQVNQLRTLDLSKNTKLVVLDCSDNNLTALDLNGRNSLTELFLDGNNALNRSAVNLESHFSLNVTEQDEKFLVDFNDVADGENIPLITAYSSDGRAAALDSYSYVPEKNVTAVFAERH